MEANDLSSLVSAVTSNPEMMRRVMGALSSLSAGNDSSAKQEGQTAPAPMYDKGDTEGFPVGLSGDGQEHHHRDSDRNTPERNGSDRHGADRKRLLIALKPYLGKERRNKAEMLINIMSLLDSGLLDMLGKGE